MYSVGRLDAESEGLLLLTNDKQINAKLLHPKNKHFRTYTVQVEKDITVEAIQKIERPMTLRINKKDFTTRPAKASLAQAPSYLWDREPPIRERKNIPTSWLKLTLTEGKNRQVRKMTSHVGFPTLRLIRESIEGIHVSELKPGGIKEWDESEFKRLLKL